MLILVINVTLVSVLILANLGNQVILMILAILIFLQNLLNIVILWNLMLFEMVILIKLVIVVNIDFGNSVENFASDESG